MEVQKISRRSCFTQTSFLGEDLGEDSQLEYLSAYEEYEEDKNNSSEFCEQGDIAEVKDHHKVPPQIAAGQEESGQSDRATQSVAVEPDVPFLPPREKAQLCKHAEPSDPSSCEKPAACTRGTSSTEDAGSQLPAPEIPPAKNPGAGTESAERSCGGSPGSVRAERGEALSSVPGVSAAVQALDAGSDCRASRSSSAQLCLCSRAVNTEITMMNKTRPLGCLGQTSADAASNTEWSFRAWSSHLQVIETKPQGPPNQFDKIELFKTLFNLSA